MEAARRGNETNTVDRQLKEATKTDTPYSPSFMEAREFNGELCKAAMRWSIYRFPVKYKPTNDQEFVLAQLPLWQHLSDS